MLKTVNVRPTVRSRRLTYAFLGLLCPFLIAPGALGAIIIVPTGQPTIQQGVDAASAGDTVLVEEGIYLENVKIFSKKLHLASRYLLDHNPQHILHTIIDGSSPTSTDSGSCLVVSGVTGGVVEGFTLTRGTGTKWFDPSDSKVYREGGGILTDGGSVTIRHNLIMNNEATINDATSAGGGGIRSGFGDVVIESNVIAYNKGLYGAGVVLFHQSGTIRNNIVWKNSGGQAFGGGGLWIWTCTDPVVMNNTIVENTAATSGGGLSLNTVTVTSLNNIVRSNTAALSPQFRVFSSAAGSTVDYSDVQGGYSGTGNFDKVPSWADSNFLLATLSPCVDSGDNLSADRDIADPGNPSLAKFPSRQTRRNDVGAYGGPYVIEFPLFTSPRIGLDVASIDFGADSTSNVTSRVIPYHKLGWGLLTIDSIRFSPGQGLSTATTLPHVTPVTFLDSITINWGRAMVGTLVDTARIFHNDTSVVNPLLVPLTGVAIKKSCCSGASGNVDCDPTEGVDISDLAALIDNLYISFAPLCCKPEANTDGSIDGGIDISDLSALIDFLYISFTPPARCL